MRITQVLLKQHIGYHFKKHWRIQGRRKPIITDAEKVLTARGKQIFEPKDILQEKLERERIEIIGFKPKRILFDETHPDWHSRKLLTYNDNNVLLEGLAQAKVITKTVELKHGLPESIVLNKISKETNERIKKIILGSHVFDAEQVKLTKIKDPERPAWNFPRIYGISENRVNSLILSKLLQLIESISERTLVKERYLLNNLLFSFPFEKNGDLIQFQLKGDTVLTSSKPLSPATKENTEELELPNLYPIKHTITLNEENIYKLENIYPIKKTVAKSHPHTIFIHYNKTEVQNLYEEEVTEAQIFGRSLLKTFTAAASYARQTFGEDIKMLPKPVTLQCVQTDGRLFHFGILQLNTLELEEGRVKNVWYQTGRIPLFEKCCYEFGKPVLEGYNNEVIKHLVSFYNNV